MPNKTANNKYTYSKTYFGKPLSEWINLVHIHLSHELNWKYFPLKPGAFGYDNLAHSISWVFIKCDGTENIEKISDYVHRGWTINYIYWKDHEPWISNKEYIKPGNKLGDDRRNMCAATPYKNLPDEEKIKDKIIAQYLIKILKKK